MNFTQSMEAGLSQYAEFEGRARRDEYWNWMLFVLVVALTVAGADKLLGSSPVLLGIVSLGLVVPTAAVQVRRLHDASRPGLLALLWLVPFGGLAVMALSLSPSVKGKNAHGH